MTRKQNATMIAVIVAILAGPVLMLVLALSAHGHHKPVDVPNRPIVVRSV